MTRVLHWEEIESWLRPLEVLLPEATSIDIATEIRGQPPEYLVSDDLSWLNQMVESQGVRDFDAQSVLAERLPLAFTHLRAYHGCRLKEGDNQLEMGLVPLDVNHACDNVRSIFQSSKFPELSPSMVDEAIASMQTKDREGRIFFEASKRLLLDHCGHYLIYGSEYIVGIATALSAAALNDKDYAIALKATGTPTLLTCDVPISLLTERTVCELASSMIAAYFEILLNSNYDHPKVGEGFGFELFHNLPADCIASVLHPLDVRDPIRPRK